MTFEGIDGAGKSTHVPTVAQWWRDRGFVVQVTREPGGTELAERLRELLLNAPMDLETELLLVFAARQSHLIECVRPALARGDVVLCDRFTDSTYAYQGGGRGVDTTWIRALEQRVHPDLQPDRTYLFDLPAEEAARRRAAARAADRFEAEDTAFFERVRAAYRARAEADPGRFVTLDAANSVADLRRRIEEDLSRIFNMI